MTAKKTAQLRALLHSEPTECLLEAHNGVSARIVEESGARGIWASGLALSVQYGVRDNNEASWTQIVDMLEFMSDVTTIPILLDGDTGYGNFNNMRRLVRKLEQRNIAGVCIEDKEFPKANSFIAGQRQALASSEEFCGKIKAGKDSQEDEHFCIVARTEALIAGQGMAEALRRGECYRAAGADAILIHSLSSQAREVLQFAEEWANRCPLVIIPTAYYSTPFEVFERAKISMVIWANHLIRSCIASMKRTAEEIVRTRSVNDLDDRIASMQTLFQLQGADELAAAEARYLAPRTPDMRAIILAASRGTALHDLTHDRPKVMLPLGGETLLEQLLNVFRSQAIHDITLIAGYREETIHRAGINVVLNEDYAHTSELASLVKARPAFRDDMIISYGDLLLRGYILRDLLETAGDVVVVVDSSAKHRPDGSAADYAWCDQRDDRSLFRQGVKLERIATRGSEPAGCWIGLMRVRGEGRRWLEVALDALQARDDFAKLAVPELLNYLVDRDHPVQVHYIHGHWLNINTLEDINRAERFAAGRLT